MTDLFDEYQEFRKILCLCPCCGDLHRVSDLRLETKDSVSRTWLDKHQMEVEAVCKKEAAFEEIKEKLRDLAQKRGRKAAEKVFNKVCPGFKSLKLDPLDVKPILNPVDVVVFKGMNNAEQISEIVLLSKKCEAPSLNSIRRQVEEAVMKNKYDWQVARIGEEGKISFE